MEVWSSNAEVEEDDVVGGTLDVEVDVGVTDEVEVEVAEVDVMPEEVVLGGIEEVADVLSVHSH